jgi:hypothetical protein
MTASKLRCAMLDLLKAVVMTMCRRIVPKPFLDFAPGATCPKITVNGHNTAEVRTRHGNRLCNTRRSAGCANASDWVHDECIPAEAPDRGEDYKTVLGELRKKARAQGLWCPFIPKEYGGMGLGPLANALVQMELGESYLGALSMNTQGPDDATMMTLLEHGTPHQKEKFLKPLLNGDKRICYSMTEKAPAPTPPACRRAPTAKATMLTC